MSDLNKMWGGGGIKALVSDLFPEMQTLTIQKNKGYLFQN